MCFYCYLPLIPVSSLSYALVFKHSVQCIISAIPVWLSSLLHMSHMVCLCACHILLPQIKYLMPLVQLITALTSLIILFASFNYSWYQLWEYWKELTCQSGAFHLLNMHSIRVCILLSKCSRVALKCSLRCPEPVSSFLRVGKGNGFVLFPWPHHWVFSSSYFLTNFLSRAMFRMWGFILN